LNRLSFPTISTISATSLEDFKSSNDVVVVGYLTPDDKDSHEAFSSLAEAMRADYLFGITNDSALAKAEQVDMPGIAIYKAFDEGKKVLHLAHDIGQMSASLRAAARPLVIDFVSELHEDYLDVSQRNYRARKWFDESVLILVV
jgi:protein disulfide-isomerase A1